MLQDDDSVAAQSRGDPEASVGLFRTDKVFLIILESSASRQEGNPSIHLPASLLLSWEIFAVG